MLLMLAPKRHEITEDIANAALVRRPRGRNSKPDSTRRPRGADLARRPAISSWAHPESECRWLHLPCAGCAMRRSAADAADTRDFSLFDSRKQYRFQNLADLPPLQHRAADRTVSDSADKSSPCDDRGGNDPAQRLPMEGNRRLGDR